MTAFFSLVKVFVNGVVISAEDTPIVIVLDDMDKANLAAMPPANYRYGCFNADLPIEECRAVMNQLSALIGSPVPASPPQEFTS